LKWLSWRKVDGIAVWIWWDDLLSKYFLIVSNVSKEEIFSNYCFKKTAVDIPTLYRFFSSKTGFQATVEASFYSKWLKFSDFNSLSWIGDKMLLQSQLFYYWNFFNKNEKIFIKNSDTSLSATKNAAVFDELFVVLLLSCIVILKIGCLMWSLIM